MLQKESAKEEEDVEGIAGIADMAGMSEKLIFAHELTHALQDETPAARPPHQGPEGRRRPRARAAVPARGRGHARHGPRRPDGPPGRRRKRGRDARAASLRRARSNGPTSPRTSRTTSSSSSSFPTPTGRRSSGGSSRAGGGRSRPALEESADVDVGDPPRRTRSFRPRTCCPDVERLSPLGLPSSLHRHARRMDAPFPPAPLARRERGGRGGVGWRGDRIAFFASGRTIAYLWRARFDSPAAAERFEAAWTKARLKGRRRRRWRGKGAMSSWLRIPEPPGPPRLQDGGSGRVGSGWARRAVGAALAAARLAWMRRPYGNGSTSSSGPCFTPWALRPAESRRTSGWSRRRRGRRCRAGRCRRGRTSPRAPPR